MNAKCTCIAAAAITIIAVVLVFDIGRCKTKIIKKLRHGKKEDCENEHCNCPDYVEPDLLD